MLSRGCLIATGWLSHPSLQSLSLLNGLAMARASSRISLVAQRVEAFQKEGALLFSRGLAADPSLGVRMFSTPSSAALSFRVASTQHRGFASVSGRNSKSSKTSEKQRQQQQQSKQEPLEKQQQLPPPPPRQQQEQQGGERREVGSKLIFFSFFLSGWAGVLLTLLLLNDQVQKVKAVLADETTPITIERIEEALRMDVQEPKQIFTQLGNNLRRQVPNSELAEYAYWSVFPGVATALNAVLIGKEKAAFSLTPSPRFTLLQVFAISLVSLYTTAFAYSFSFWLNQARGDRSWNEVSFDYKDLLTKSLRTTWSVTPYVPMATLSPLFMTRNIFTAPTAARNATPPAAAIAFLRSEDVAQEELEELEETDQDGEENETEAK